MSVDNIMDLSALNSLSPDEREYALKVLGQYAEGSSKLLDDLRYADYKEIPADIVTFIKDYQYLGRAWHLADGKCKLFPYWENKLQELFPDNITTNYNTFIESGARGLGKSEIAVACALYLMHRLMCLKNPHLTLNLKPTEQVAFAFMNITQALALDIGMVKFQNTVQCSPWFMSRGTITGMKQKVWNPPDFIKIIIGSQSSDVIGQAVYFSFFDEISFIRNQDVEVQKAKALDMVDTSLGGMLTRFTNHGKNPTLLVLASSKRSEKSFMEEHIKKKSKTDKTRTLIVDEPVWNVRPASEYSGRKFYVAQGNRFLNSEVLPLETEEKDLDPWIKKGYRILTVPIEYHAKFLEEIDRALCDYAGVSSSDLLTYISGTRLQAVKNENFKNPFTKDIIEVGNSDKDYLQYYNFFDMSLVDPQLKSRPLYIHLDMSMSGDKTGIAGVWIVKKKPSENGQPQSKELYYRLAFSVAIQAPKGYQVSFEKNRQFIYWLKEQGFNIKGVSTDTFQSADLAQQLKSKGYDYQVISVDRVSPTSKVCEPYHYLKNTIYEGRIEMYDSRLLTEELLGLEKNSATGRVDHSPLGINCFTADTKISLTDGREIPIVDLIGEVKQGKTNYVYSFNETLKRIEPKRVTNGWCSGKTSKIAVVTLDNGEVIECTPEHRFMLRDGSYCEAQHLVSNDSLMPLYRKYPTRGLCGYRLYYDPMQNKWHFEHRQFATEIYDKKYLVHHIDCNPKNNNPDNLIWMSREAHIDVHAKLQTGAQSPEANAKRKASVKKWWDENKNTDNDYMRIAVRYNKSVEEVAAARVYQEKHKQEKIEEINKFFGVDYNSLDRTSQIHYMRKYNNYLMGYDIFTDKWTPVIEKRSSAASYYNCDYDQLNEHERRSMSIKYARVADPTYQERVSKAISENHKNGKYKNAAAALKKCNEASHQAKLDRYHASKKYQEILEMNELYGIDYESLPQNEKISYIHRYHNSKKKNIVNHKVASVYIIDKEVDVYDITVEDNHNFALTAGVIVHNSKDTADAVCGAVWNASRNADEFEYDFGETLDTVMTANADNGVSAQAQQLSIDFENEMKKMLDTTPTKISDPGKPTTEPAKTTFTPSVIDGIILW